MQCRYPRSKADVTARGLRLPSVSEGRFGPRDGDLSTGGDGGKPGREADG
jgi:hypothetical protein